MTTYENRFIYFFTKIEIILLYSFGFVFKILLFNKNKEMKLC
jgi:hypothetical protein